jgi:hypothetical protein
MPHHNAQIIYPLLDQNVGAAGMRMHPWGSGVRVSKISPAQGGHDRGERGYGIYKGPGVPDGRVDHRLVANIDLAPTFA